MEMITAKLTTHPWVYTTNKGMEMITAELTTYPCVYTTHKGIDNLVPRSHFVTWNVRSGKVRFRACSVPARLEIRAFLSLRMFVLSNVILSDFAE